ncbi:MAG TPA: hypothetical protein ENL45_02110, partial [Candidatus Woesearchaeota archaeon]|nr:hypothetical protein [Candidatus Woesearchaeota archaeon]
MKKKVRCYNCGVEFYRNISAVDRYSNNRSFCSLKCFREASSNKKNVKCDNCGKVIFRIPSKLKRNNHNFCSRKCADEYKKKVKNHKRICMYCGREFYIVDAEIKKGGGKFCSRRCKDVFYRGERSNLWKGGISKLPYPFEFNDELKELIRKRDGYKCQLCGVPQ